MAVISLRARAVAVPGPGGSIGQAPVDFIECRYCLKAIARHPEPGEPEICPGGGPPALLLLLRLRNSAARASRGWGAGDGQGLRQQDGDRPGLQFQPAAPASAAVANGSAEGAVGLLRVVLA